MAIQVHILHSLLFLCFFSALIPVTGNGLQCFDANGTMAVSGDAYVELEMTLKSEVK